jgi:hypothetical protein
MNTQQYVEELLILNAPKLASYRDANWYAHLLLGLIEELLELQVKINTEEEANPIILETGDVLAYSTLIASAQLYDSTTHVVQLAEKVALVLSPYTEAPSPTPLPAPSSASKQRKAATAAAAAPAAADAAAVAEATSTFTEQIKEVAGKAKRWFRERQPLELAEVGNALKQAIEFANLNLTRKLKLSPVSFSQVAQANVAKLKQRAQNKTLFAGSGDTR